MRPQVLSSYPLTRTRCWETSDGMHRSVEGNVTFQSSRSACIGSIDAALCAGSSEATDPITNSPIATPV